MVQTKPVYVAIQPDNAISFTYVPRKYLASKLTLKNLAQHNVAFRVKTNVPANYLVKPHSGYLLANASIEINITKQPADYELNTTIDDKFLINSIPLENSIDLSILEDSKNFNAVWDSVPKSKVQAQKLPVRLNFEAIKSGQESESPKVTVSKAKGDISEDSASDTEASSPQKKSKEADTPKWNILESPLNIQKNPSAGSPEKVSSPTFKLMKKEPSIDIEQFKEMKKSLEEKIIALEKRIRENIVENSVINKKNQDLAVQIQVHEKMQQELCVERGIIKQNIQDAKVRLVEEEKLISAQKEASGTSEAVLNKDQKLPNPFIEKSYNLLHMVIIGLGSIFIGSVLSE